MKTTVVAVLLLFSAVLLAAPKSSDPAPVPVEQEPHHHTLLKNDSILVMHVTIPEGERTLYHIHSRDRVAIELSHSNISQQNLNEPEGTAGATKPGDLSAPASSLAPVTHRIHNVGPGPFDVLDIEFLRPPGKITTPAAPVAIENRSARVYKWVLAPGATSAVHTHYRPYLIVAVTSMPLKMTAPDGQSSSHEIQTGDFHWVEASVTHSLTNEGTKEGQIVEVELK
jgi:quercetin dioxygenase-like cupin family protein